MCVRPPTVGESPYRPRAPALGLLHRVVREWLAAFRELRPDLPFHVVQAFEEFLDCGILANGFTRLRCADCGHERLLPFSCKGRLCPSCNGRRMIETAAHLVDRVLPPAPYRQWVLSLPRRVRYLLVTRKELLAPVLEVYLRTLWAWQRRRARKLGVEKPLTGSITCLQRFGDALNLNLHFHAFLPDGVFFREADTGPILFQTLPPPTVDDLDELVLKLWRRINKKLKTLGAWEPELEDELDSERHELGRAVSEQLVAFDPDDEEAFERKGLSAFRFGYSLHAGVAVEAHDREGLERILRYGLRPPFASGRLEEGPRGELYYRLRKPLRDGRTMLVLEPKDLLRRLANFVPPKGQNQVRYHGVFAPNSKHRPALALLAARAAADTASPPRPTPALPEGEGQARPRGRAGEGPIQKSVCRAEAPLEVRPRRIPWAELLKRTFQVDLTICEGCGGRVEVLAVITDPRVIRRILKHLHLATNPPPRGSVTLGARGPPGGALDAGPSIDDLLMDEQP
ncbi:MAG: transposase [Deltaproteobacteria bacterium]|nr:transposase [Deltaproteobacteria bacterium]